VAFRDVIYVLLIHLTFTCWICYFNILRDYRWFKWNIVACVFVCSYSGVDCNVM